MIRQKQYILGFKVNKTFWITFHTAKHFSTLLPVILWLFIRNESHGWRGSCIWTVNSKQLQEEEFHSIKGTLSSLKYILETESPFEKMLSTLNTLLVLMIFKFLSWVFGHVEKWLDYKEANFKIYDATTWLQTIATHILIMSQKGKAIKQWYLVSQ